MCRAQEAQQPARLCAPMTAGNTRTHGVALRRLTSTTYGRISQSDNVCFNQWKTRRIGPHASNQT